MSLFHPSSSESHPNASPIDASQTRNERLARRLDVALRLNEEQIRRMMNFSMIGIYFCDATGRISEANDVFFDLIGYTHEDLQANRVTWDGVTPPEYQWVDEQISAELIKDKVSSAYEKQYISKQGKRIPVLVKVAVLEEQKETTLEVVFVLDLSDRKQAEAALRKSEEQLNLASEAANMGNWELNLLTGEEIWSEKIHAIYGFAVGTIKPTYEDFYNAIYPDDRELVRRANEQAMQTGFYQAEHRILQPDGSIRWVFSVGKVSYDEAGKPIQLSGLDADITEQKQTQQKLLLAQERLQHLLSASSAIIYSAKVIGDYDFTFISDTVTAILGYAPQDCLAANFWIDRLHPDDASTTAAAMDELLKQGYCTFEYRFRHRDGTYRWLYDQCKLVWDDTESLVEIVGSLVDISDRKQVEAQLSSSLEEKNFLLREIHHRVKNNLQVVSSLLRLQSKNVTDAATLDLLQQSQNRLHAMALIHEKLYKTNNLAKINFADYVRSLVDELCQTYDTDNDKITLHLDISAIELSIETIHCCGLILNELISNTFKHAFPKHSFGDIYVSFVENSANSYTLTVKDNGIGLPSDLEVENTNSLGLRLVSVLVRQLQGALDIERENGSCFQLTFESPVKLTNEN